MYAEEQVEGGRKSGWRESGEGEGDGRTVKG